MELLNDFDNYVKPLATDYEICAEMKQVVTTMPIGIETEHVKGRQDHTIPYADLPCQAQVNTDMESQANAIRQTDIPVPPIPVFKSTCVAVLINNSVVTDKSGKRLCTHITSRPLLQYQ